MMPIKETKLLEPFPSSICAACGFEYASHANGSVPHRFVTNEEAILIMEAGDTVRRRQEVA